MFAKFEVYKAMVETKIGKKLKTFQFDNDGKFTSKDFSNFCEVHNITMQLANFYTSQQNGVTTPNKRTFVELAHNMLESKNLPKSFWGKALFITCYVQNRSFMSYVPSKTFYEC